MTFVIKLNLKTQIGQRLSCRLIISTFFHLEESVKDDVDFLKASIKKGTHLSASGWIYDSDVKGLLDFFF